MPSLCEKPCATKRALYLMISLSSLRFRTNTHLFPTGFYTCRCLDYRSKTSRFINECNSACIASFYLGQSFLCLHSFVFCGSGSSSFCMMSKATWKQKYYSHQNYFDPFLTSMHITYEISLFLGTCTSSGAICSCCISSGIWFSII